MTRIECGLLVALGGCALPAQKNVQFSQAVDDLHGVVCPENRIAIEQQRQFGSDRVYALDACGRKLEVEERLEFPSSYSDLNRISDEEMTLLVGNLATAHFALTPSIEAQIAAWCGEESARLAGESIARCQRRLPREVQPIGVEERKDGDVDIWFKLADRAFTARTALALPPCDHMILSDTPEACRCRGGSGCAGLAGGRGEPEPLAEQDPESEGAGRAPIATVHGRGEFGVSYLRTSLSGNESYRGTGFGAGIFTGARFFGVLAISGGFTLQKGFHRQRIELPECSEFGVCSARSGRTDVGHLGVWLKSSVYPFRSLGLHLDAAAGAIYAWQNYAPPHLKEMDAGLGPSFFFGAGYEVMPDERWILGFTARQTMMVGSEVSGSATDGWITLGMIVDY